MRSFGSDNNSGVHPRIMDAIIESNTNHAIGYGDDNWTRIAEQVVQKAFENDKITPYFVLNGTGANVVALQACVSSFHSIICATTAHIAVDECGAPTKLTGCMLKEIPTSDGKLTPELVSTQLHGFGVAHNSQPKVIAITQATELGTLYNPDEIKALADIAHENDMYLFMDGTRLSNACASANLTLKEMTEDCGVDILTFGGTKNGLMIGEAVIALRPELEKNLQFYRKQTTQLYSKMRYISSQFIPYMNENIWLENAQKSNGAAQLLAKKMSEFECIELTQKVESNIILFTIPKEISDKMQEHYFFYNTNEATNEMRLVCSWDTTKEDINAFISHLNTLTS